MAGWVKIHRELLDKPIWFESTPEQIKILMTLLLMASHKETEWEWQGKKYVAKPGQFVTSLPSIVKKSGKGISIQNVRTALKRFEKLNFLTDESTKQNRLITILNWASYQRLDDVSEKEKTTTQQTSQQSPNSHLTAIKNVRTKELKESNKKKRSKVAPSTADLENAHLLYEKILTNLPALKKPNFETWGNSFRLLREQDGIVNDKEIKFLINFSQEHKFWKKFVHSAASFRDKYNKVYLEAKDVGDKRRASEKKPGISEAEDYVERLRQEQRQGAIEIE